MSTWYTRRQMKAYGNVARDSGRQQVVVCVALRTCLILTSANILNYLQDEASSFMDIY